MPTEGVEVDVGNGIKLMKMKVRHLLCDIPAQRMPVSPSNAAADLRPLVQAEDDGGDSGKANFRTETTTIVLSSTAPNAEEVINAFVDKARAAATRRGAGPHCAIALYKDVRGYHLPRNLQAFAWYKANNLQKKDEKRYMFVMIRPRVGGSSEERRCARNSAVTTHIDYEVRSHILLMCGSQPGAEPHLYKRYAISDEKKFCSLFFPAKPQARRRPSERLARLLLCGPRPR